METSSILCFRVCHYIEAFWVVKIIQQVILKRSTFLHILYILFDIFYLEVDDELDSVSKNGPFAKLCTQIVSTSHDPTVRRSFHCFTVLHSKCFGVHQLRSMRWTKSPLNRRSSNNSSANLRLFLLYFTILYFY